MLNDLPFTLSTLQAAYAEGVKPVDVLKEVFLRIRAAEDPGIFIHLRSEESLIAEAEALGPYDSDKPLWGIPYAVKDNIDVEKIPTTAGCPAYAYMPKQDAFVIAKLRQAGAIMIGKTNLDQFATGLVGLRTPYDAPLNSIDPKIVPGGSSSGSSVIVGHGIVTFSLGTDTAGSGRVPAALNNIVGLKPSLGSLSATGVVPACRTLDTISIFALTVDDAFSILNVAQGFDEADAYSKPLKINSLFNISNPLKIGVPDQKSIKFFGDTVQAATFARDVERLKTLGMDVVYINFDPFYHIAQMLYEGAWVAERYTVLEDILSADPESVHPVTRKIIMRAETMSAAKVFRGIYRLADLARIAAPVMSDLTALCVPTIPTFYSVSDLEADPVTPNNNLGTYTNFVNLLDMCGIAVPTTARSDGRPGSITFLSKAGMDATVASLARQLELDCKRNMGATSFALSNPAQLPTKNNEHLELAVCGAHMSGLPLNSQLTDLGATFVRKAKTSSQYQLFALAGGPPARPGLIRSDLSKAAAVSLEIWSIPKTALGSFLEGIPAPLGIGSIELSDKTWIKGFLCEKNGIYGATDITHLGDWRKFLSQTDT